ncbi:MAG: response regulator [Nitrospirales bacterium]|nr:response regulator [Nitrospira sp.]MDR4501497.1 response regulator [Nitrospirales bacterium]
MEKLLLVDDEPKVVNGFVRHLREHYEIHTAGGGAEGLQVVRSNGPFAVIVSDYAMPDMNGVQFLEEVTKIDSESIRVILTGFADLEIAMNAVNRGQIFRFLTKPCSIEDFKLTLQAGIEQYRLVRAEKELLEQTLTGSVKALIEVLALVNPEAMGRANRLRRYVKEFSKDLGLENSWKFEIAALLSQMDCIEMAPSSGDANGHPISQTESTQKPPFIGAKVLANIPRLEDVVEILSYQDHHHHDVKCASQSQTREHPPIGARLLQVAADFDRLRMQDMPRGQAYEHLVDNQEKYDPAVMQSLKKLFVPDQRHIISKLPLSALQPHMVLAEGIFSEQGETLVAKGQDLSEWMITWLSQRTKWCPIQEPIAVVTQEEQVTT